MSDEQRIVFGKTGSGKSSFVKKAILDSARWQRQAEELGGQWVSVSPKADLSHKAFEPPPMVVIDPASEYEALVREVPPDGHAALARMFLQMGDEALVMVERRTHGEIERDEERVELSGTDAHERAMSLTSLKASRAVLEAAQAEITRRAAVAVAQQAAEAMRASRLMPEVQADMAQPAGPDIELLGRGEELLP